MFDTLKIKQTINDLKTAFPHITLQSIGFNDYHTIKLEHSIDREIHLHTLSYIVGYLSCLETRSGSSLCFDSLISKINDSIPPELKRNINEIYPGLLLLALSLGTKFEVRVIGDAPLIEVL
ncbi:hypothetical protein JK628_23110 (plasmid) [Shewanella sp. KX20019]|uniref:hypothetical protein n=1 Tax=Shewanella sp. KX20019 TaxID=2803864 RepID=UPI00192840C1|nr:hypothetical protein [Shewanella sp. KX20019]QQX82704.1 hypothetical protein JK628_23110 [Shewanella sp. KX20019]